MSPLFRGATTVHIQSLLTDGGALIGTPPPPDVGEQRGEANRLRGTRPPIGAVECCVSKARGR